MGHLSMAERRRRAADKKLREVFKSVTTVQFWCSQYDEIVEGMFVGLRENKAEIMYLGGPVIRSLFDFKEEKSENRNAWWVK